MPKTVTFVHLEEKLESSIIATFFNAYDVEIHRKILNDVEIAGLKKLIKTDKLPLTVEADHLIKKFDRKPFSRPDGEPTGFELLLVDLVYKR